MTTSPIPSDRHVLNALMTYGANDLSEAAAILAQNISAGRYEEDGDLSLQVDLAHLMDLLVLIWHRSKMMDREHEDQSQADYERSCLRIPRLQDGYELVDLE